MIDKVLTSERRASPESNGQNEGKSWDKVKHGRAKRRRAIQYPSIAQSLRNKTVEALNQRNPK